MDFFDAVTRRRSVRRFTSTAVPPAVMQRAFEAAQLAPNSSNLQTWEFYWVRNPEKRRRLVAACLSQGAARTAQELVVVVSVRRLWKPHAQRLLSQIEKGDSPALEAQRKYYGVLIPFVYGFRWLTPVKWLLFHVGGIFRPLMRRPVTGRDLDEVSIKSAALAAENFMLAISAQEFDTCPMEGFDEVRVRRLLNVPRSSRIVMVIGVGEREAKGIWGKQIRFPFDSFLKEV